MSQKKCPMCSHVSDSRMWDDSTKEINHIEDDDGYISCTEDKDKLKDVDAFFNCPICNEEIAYKDMIDAGEE